MLCAPNGSKLCATLHSARSKQMVIIPRYDSSVVYPASSQEGKEASARQ